MEEEKAVAYYDELTRKGGGAARFKQGLGFSSSSSAGDTKPLPHSPAPPPGVAAEIQKQARLECIQNKLKKKPAAPQPSSFGGDNDAARSHRTRGRTGRSRSRSRSRERDGSSTGRHSHGRRRVEDDEGSYRPRRRRSRSRSGSEERGSSQRSRRGQGEGSPPPLAISSRWSDRSHRYSHGERKDRPEPDDSSKNRNARTYYSQLIDDYSQMTPAERVKAKMKLQLSQTAAKDMANGVTTGWERFDFDKEAPLDDEEIEVAEDDESLVKDIGRSFRLTAVESRREEEVKAAHDQAMFGTSSVLLEIPEKEESTVVVTEEKEERTQVNDESLISEKVLISKHLRHLLAQISDCMDGRDRGLPPHFCRPLPLKVPGEIGSVDLSTAQEAEMGGNSLNHPIQVKEEVGWSASASASTSASAEVVRWRWVFMAMCLSWRSRENSSVVLPWKGIGWEVSCLSTPLKQSP
ncbi:unnamed protein product [Spirodela intermedia]|uniref:Uncharacterized protein n=1 Tax=Spirodela intermedia TaxID=51605 RepID=A0A7I8JKE3_SPIIN|nr:unnamed protein product [Spirodela intermedia]CAA6670599.1 unnamed protein product [Spirodela intermedia]